MPPSVTAVTAVTTADADERTRVRAAHAIGARCRGEAQPRCNETADQLFRRSGRRVYHEFGGHAFVNVC
jgi:predicted secreted protein